MRASRSTSKAARTSIDIEAASRVQVRSCNGEAFWSTKVGFPPTAVPRAERKELGADKFA